MRVTEFTIVIIFLLAAGASASPRDTNKATLLKLPVFKNNLTPGLAETTGSRGPMPISASEAKTREKASISEGQGVPPTAPIVSSRKTAVPTGESREIKSVPPQKMDDAPGETSGPRSGTWWWLLLLVPAIGALVVFRKRT